jgi:hypothetical protein
MSDRTYYSEEAKAKARRKNMMAIGEALIAGLAVGVAGGLLASKKTRDQIAKTVDSRADEAKGLGKMLAKRGKKQLQEAEDEADGFVSSIRRRFA